MRSAAFLSISKIHPLRLERKIFSVFAFSLSLLSQQFAPLIHLYRTRNMSSRPPHPSTHPAHLLRFTFVRCNSNRVPRLMECYPPELYADFYLTGQEGDQQVSAVYRRTYVCRYILCTFPQKYLKSSDCFSLSLCLSLSALDVKVSPRLTRVRVSFGA